MSPLEAARRLMDRAPWDVGEPAPACVSCGGFRMDGHRPDCPELALPQIVAALESAERTVDAPMVVIEEHLMELSRALKGKNA